MNGEFVAFAAALVLYLIAFVLLVASLWVIPLALHESGHLVAAKAMGYRIMEVIVGPIGIYYSHVNRYVIGRIEVDGRVRAHLPLCRNLMLRHAIFVAGGPVATAVTMCGAILMISALSAEHAPLKTYLAFFVVVSGIVLVGVLAPVQVKGMSTDGLQLLSFLVRRRQMRAELELLSAHRAQIENQPPLQWVRPARALLKEFPEGLPGALIYVALEHALSTADFELARELLDVRTKAPPAHSLEIAQQHALFAALVNGDPGPARDYLTCGALLAHGDVGLVEAIMFDAIGDLPAAAHALESYARSLTRLAEPELLLALHRWALEYWARKKAGEVPRTQDEPVPAPQRA